MAQKNLFPTKIYRETLNALVDRAADLIRTAVDYKFILVLLFLKRLNDVRKREREETKDRLIKESGLSEKEAEEEAEKFDDFYTFDIPKQYLWDEIGGDIKNLPEMTCPPNLGPGDMLEFDLDERRRNGQETLHSRTNHRYTSGG